MMETAWKALQVLGANTAEVPVYWEQVEPQEGQFSFDHLDGIIRGARDRGLRLVLLWFATWKNGSMQYAPEWVKNNPGRFPRVQTSGGVDTWVLSSHFQETFEADRKAFCELIGHLKTYDSTDGTVIGVQIENEPGILGSARDYSPTAETEFHQPIPIRVKAVLGSLNPGPLQTAWTNAGRNTSGTWSEVFGSMAAEVFTTWSIANYIDRLAEAGKQIYPVPMYANVWLGENGWQIPGVSYPSGGPVSFVLDLWKAATPHLDIIAPDIYLEAQAAYNQVCENYHRPDNPLFVPESGGSESNALNLFEAICRYNAVGIAVFGIESLLEPGGSIRPQAQMLVESFAIVRAMIPLITRYHGTGMLQAVVQREFMHDQLLDLGSFHGLVRFGKPDNFGFTDYRFRGAPPTRGRGIVVMPEPREIFLAGTGFHLTLLEKHTDERRYFTQANVSFDSPLTHFLRVEEGHFTPGGDWVVDRVRNGDEVTSGLWVASDCGIVHAVLG